MSESDTDVLVCQACVGSGKVGIVPKDWTTGWEGEREECLACNGTGKVSKHSQSRGPADNEVIKSSLA
jgi:DnaJ-class molecular chaperone